MRAYLDASATYDPIEHLAKTHGAEWREIHLGMWTMVCDASGKEIDPNTPLFVVSGFLAPADAWIEFAPKWKEILGPIEYWSSAHMARMRPDVLSKLVDMI